MEFALQRLVQSSALLKICVRQAHIKQAAATLQKLTPRRSNVQDLKLFMNCALRSAIRSCASNRPLPITISTDYSGSPRGLFFLKRWPTEPVLASDVEYDAIVASMMVVIGHPPTGSIEGTTNFVKIYQNSTVLLRTVSPSRDLQWGTYLNRLRELTARGIVTRIRGKVTSTISSVEIKFFKAESTFSWLFKK